MLKKLAFIFVVVGLLLVGLMSLASAQGSTYESTVNAKARSCPEVDCTVVTTLRRGTKITAIDIVDGDKFNGITDWIKFSYNGRTAYVHASLMKLSSGSAAPAASSGNSTTSSGNSTTSSGNSTTSTNNAVPTQETVIPQAPLSCGTCSQMASCDQARACLAAGHSRLDRDNDGVPCESICGGG